MSSAPIVDRIRIIPRPDDFLDRNVGSSGEVFFNRETSSLRVFNGRDRSGYEIARADLGNVSDDDLNARLADLNISSGSSSGASVDVSETAPTEPEAGNLWLNTTNGRLYIYINDGDTSQWMQPAVPSFSGLYNDLSGKPALATVATSGSYNDLTDRPTFGDSGFDGSYDSLTNKPTSFSGLTSLGLSTGTVISEFSIDTTLADASTTAVPTENAVKTYVDTSISNISSFDSLGVGALTAALASFRFTTEVVTTITGATGTVTHDFFDSAVFYHSSIASDFTANFDNVPVDDNRTISTVLILEQGATAYIPTALEIQGSAQTINWQGASTPSGNPNQLDIVSFTLIRTGSSWTVIGSLTTYG